MARQHWHITGKVLTALVALTIVSALVILGVLIHHGLSARANPTLLETWIARSVRHLATPSSMRNLRNPVALTEEGMNDARAHWADHCATCHGNDGSGNTELARGMYPKPPDMRTGVTQNLTDGELFAIIRNGVRLTGMPAWGDAEGHDDADNWKLVHFIRHLPKVTPAEIEQMESLNPKTAAEWQRLQEEAAFLSGEISKPSAMSHHMYDHSSEKPHP